MNVEYNPADVLPTGGAVHRGDIDGALDSLRWVADRMRSQGDARAIFPDIYAIITQNVRDALTQGYFLEPKFISTLAGCFAGQYLETLAHSLTGTAQDSSAWGLAYQRAAAAEALPVEHAALGISAHINYDLALGIYQTILRLGIDKDAEALARFKRDHDAVNDLLEKSLPECLERLMGTYSCQATPLLTGAFRRFAHRRIMSMLCRWRERVWENVLALLGAETDEARQLVVEKMGRTALREGQVMSALCRTSRALVH